VSLLTPWFLLGLLALALPLWLHRLERQTAERRPWSSLAFFRPSPESQVRRRRFRYLVLMGCRLLLLALLTLLFARPTLDARSALAPLSGRWHLIAVDTSLSMGHGGEWARAAQAVDHVLAGLGAADRSQLLAFGPGVRVLGAPTGDHGSWRGGLRALSATGARGSYGELGEAVRALAQAEGPAPTLHVVSDFQQSAAPERFADLGLPPGADLVTHDVSAPPRPNWCIEGVTGPARLHGPQRASLEVVVAGFDTPAAARRVEMRIGDRVVGTAEVNVPPAGRATALFTDLEVPRGRSRAQVQIHPPDGLPADDVFFVGLERTESLPVLFLREAGDARAELYYRTGLESGGAGMFELAASTPEAAQTLALDRFAFVVLYDLPRLPALLEGKLRAFVEGGRAALVVAGPSVARRRALTWLRGAVGEAARADRPRHALADASSHLIARATEGLADVRFHRHLRAEAPVERVVVRLSDGAPLLFEASLGAGRLLVLTAPFDPAWTDWPVHVSFVPFVLTSARWLAGLEGTAGRAAVGDVLDLGQGGSSPAASIEVIGPDGRRALGLAASVRERKLTLDRAGFYEVRRAGRTEDVAVNPDARESDLRALDPATLARWKTTGGPPADRVPGREDAERRDLAYPLAFVLAAAVLVESTLANRHLTQRPK
jgi:hypothetical protein